MTLACGGKKTEFVDTTSHGIPHFGLAVVRMCTIFEKVSVAFNTPQPISAMSFISRLLFAVIGLMSVLLSTTYSADAPEKKKGSSANASPQERKPVHLVVRSAAEIKQTFTYAPYPAVPDELEGYTGSQVGGTGTYRLTVDAEGAVNHVAILKGFTVTAVYDERFSDVKGNAVPALDKVMVQALMRWRAKPGQSRVVDIYWSFGTRPWLNYGKPNGSE
jgi:hypothetical protein